MRLTGEGTNSSAEFRDDRNIQGSMPAFLTGGHTHRSRGAATQIEAARGREKQPGADAGAEEGGRAACAEVAVEDRCAFLLRIEGLWSPVEAGGNGGGANSSEANSSAKAEESGGRSAAGVDWEWPWPDSAGGSKPYESFEERCLQAG